MDVQSAFTAVATHNVNYQVPNTYAQAMKHPDADKWKIAATTEVQSMKKNQVFIPSTLPPGKHAIPCRWVFTIKLDSNNQIIKYKGRIVVQGFHQKEGIDYDLTFAPTVKSKSIKLMLALAAKHDWEIDQLDYETAFLNASLAEEIYVKIPPGYGVHDSNRFPVLRLNKALYGLKQAPREWWLELDQFLKGLGYTATALDECLYQKLVGDQRIYLTLYVDDTLAIYHQSIQDVWLADKAAIANKYAIKDLGPCKWILNLAVDRDRNNRTITLSQRAYIEQILINHQMIDCKPAKTPFWTNDLSVVPDKVNAIKLTQSEHEEYRSIIGSIMYAAIITRIDLGYIGSMLARYTTEPYKYHLVAARHVLRYLKGCIDLKLIFGSNNSPDPSQYNLTIFTDSDWAQERVDRKSVGGWILLLDGRPIAWQSKKQNTIALSSTEAEYYALGESVREALYIRQWFYHYVGRLLPVHIKCDNQGALLIADHSTNHGRTKHIDIQHYFVREHVWNKSVLPSFISTTDQLADILTKATATSVFLNLRAQLLI